MGYLLCDASRRYGPRSSGDAALLRGGEDGGFERRRFVRPVPARRLLLVEGRDISRGPDAGLRRRLKHVAAGAGLGRLNLLFGNLRGTRYRRPSGSGLGLRELVE